MAEKPKNDKYWQKGTMVRVPNHLLSKVKAKHPEWENISAVGIVTMMMLNEVNKK